MQVGASWMQNSTYSGVYNISDVHAYALRRCWEVGKSEKWEKVKRELSLPQDEKNNLIDKRRVGCLLLLYSEILNHVCF